jgi:hypothetical protein
MKTKPHKRNITKTRRVITAAEREAVAKPGTQIVRVPYATSNSGVTSSAPVSLRALPESWGKKP